MGQGCQVLKNKKAKFVHKQFQKGQFLKNEKGHIKAKFCWNNKIQSKVLVTHFIFAHNIAKNDEKDIPIFET